MNLDQEPMPADAGEWQKMLEEEWLWRRLEDGELDRNDFDERSDIGE
jgi:hypothetical protein